MSPCPLHEVSRRWLRSVCGGPDFYVRAPRGSVCLVELLWNKLVYSLAQVTGSASATFPSKHPRSTLHPFTFTPLSAALSDGGGNLRLCAIMVGG
jgi:hypothetical protein